MNDIGNFRHRVCELAVNRSVIDGISAQDEQCVDRSSIHRSAQSSKAILRGFHGLRDVVDRLAFIAKRAIDCGNQCVCQCRCRCARSDQRCPTI